MATTWSTVANNDAVLATCTTGSESAPSGPTEGIPFHEGKYLVLTIEAGGAITAGNLNVYFFNPVTSVWSLITNIAATVTGGGTSECLIFPSISGPGNKLGEPLSTAGRVAAVPSGLGVAVNVYHFMVRR